MTVGIGAGLYPNATVEEYRRIRAPVVLVMKSADQGAFIADLRAIRPDVLVVGRLHEEWVGPVDWSDIRGTAERWGRALVAAYRGHADAVVGPNEYVGNRDPWELWALAGELEATICTIVQDAGLPYLFGSFAPGNCDPGHLAGPLARVREQAAGVCYHAYARPDFSRLEAPAEKWWFWRPLWWAEQGVCPRFVFLGEAGSWWSWKARMGEDAYVDLLKEQAAGVGELRRRGIAVSAPCVYAVGALGGEGERWNVGPAFLDRAGRHNDQANEPEPRPAIPQTAIPQRRERPVRHLTHWLSPVDADPPRTVDEAIERARRNTPRGWTPAILWPAVYAHYWQRDCDRTLPDELAPAGPADLVAIRAQVEGAGLGFGAWAVPRQLSRAEARAHRAAAIAAGYLCLDVEPYDGFLVEPRRSPIAYLTAYWEGHETPTGLSLVPRERDLDALGDALEEWLDGVNEVRPQVYFTDDPTLAYPGALLVLRRRMRRLGFGRRPVIPVLPCRAVGGQQTDAILRRRRSHTDLFRLV